MHFYCVRITYMYMYITLHLCPPLPSLPSQYNRTDVLPGELYHDTQALEAVWSTLWQLALAGLARGILTVFTYGMKV